MNCSHTLEEKTFKNGTKHLWCPVCKRHRSRGPNLAAKSKFLKRKFGDHFYTYPAWLDLRYKVLAKGPRVCALCGSPEKPLHVDHIKPRSKYPELSLSLDNLQILCASCNLGKGADDEQDFREEPK